MTDTQFYTEMDELAAELLAEFGSPATLRVLTKGKPDAQGIVQTVPADTAGLAVRTESKQVQAMFEKAATAVLVVKFPADPAAEARILHGGATWKIQEAKLVKPLGTSMIVAFVSCVAP